MNWNLIVDNSAKKFLKKIPKQDSIRITSVLDDLAANPYFGDIQKIKGLNDSWRRRVGSYRIFYKIKILERVILVFHFERRNSKTY